jgi:hypothetical protein
MSVAQSETVKGCGGGEELAKGRIAVIPGGIVSRVTGECKYEEDL